MEVLPGVLRYIERVPLQFLALLLAGPEGRWSAGLQVKKGDGGAVEPGRWSVELQVRKEARGGGQRNQGGGC